MEKNTQNVQFWTGKIASYEREFKHWETRVSNLIEKYRCEQKPLTEHSCQFNILWSNVQTILPAVFAKLPKPDVSRRFSDNDPIGRVASMMLERALEFEIDHYPDYRAAMENSVLDRFLGGRGIAWVRYEPHFKAAQQEGLPEDGFQITEDADENESEEAQQQEELDYECAPVDYVDWKDFGHTYARTWEEVTAVWRRVYMTRDQLVERFGEELGAKIPLDTRPEDEKKMMGGNAGELYQSAIFEIWDKSSKKAIWISKSWPDILDEKDDPMKLESFWPCPRPLYSTLTPNSLVPVPDYIFYQDQAISLDLISERIDKLIQALQVKGVHDAAVPELARLFTEGGNGDLIPVKNWAAFAEKNGLSGAINLVDLKPIVEALNAGYQALEQVKNEIFEIMGIADIVRGASDPNETATATRTKGQFGSLRLRSMQNEVAQYATEILQIKAQIMCMMFQPETLLAISAVDQLSPQDQQMIPQALQMLKNRPLRNFRIEISSDSLVQLDDMQEKADRMEFLKTAGGFIQNLTQLSQSPLAPQLAPLAVSMMKYGVTAYKVGKGLEGEFDSTLESIKAMIAQKAQQPPQPPPQIQLEQMKQQGEMQGKQFEAQVESQRFLAEQQAEQQKAQRDLQTEQMRLQMEDAARQREAANEIQVEQMKQSLQAQQIAHQNELEAQRSALQYQQEQATERMRMAQDQMLEQSRQQFELLLARLDHANKIDLAEIKSASVIDQQQIAAANEGSQDDSPV